MHRLQGSIRAIRRRRRDRDMGNADQGTLANVPYFIGSWFFTAAGMVQPVLSGR